MSSMLKNINREDLKKFVHYILFENNTSGTSVLDTQQISLMELGEEGVVLRAPTKSCQQKHNLTLYLYFMPLELKIKSSRDLKSKKNKHLSVIGIVKDKELVEGEDYCYIKVDFTQFDEYQWEQFLMLYEERQELMNKVARDTCE
ncbi:MAG: hypothetical protein KAG61_07565 [Bacteriovoracaceae bacterium]|nr:hypothetical protein [Bacteriovoracaceae bacterium]